MVLHLFHIRNLRIDDEVGVICSLLDGYYCWLLIVVLFFWELGCIGSRDIQLVFFFCKHMYSAPLSFFIICEPLMCKYCTCCFSFTLQLPLHPRLGGCGQQRRSHGHALLLGGLDHLQMVSIWKTSWSLVTHSTVCARRFILLILMC